MPEAPWKAPTIDAAALASKLPRPLQWLGGATLEGLKQATGVGTGDPNQVMGIGAPLMAAEGEGPAMSALKGLYSRVQQAAESLPDWVHPAKALSTLKNLASGEELNYRNVPEFLGNRMGPQKMAKSDLLQHLEQNPMPDVQVKTLGLPKQGYSSFSLGQGETPSLDPVQYNRPDFNLPGGKNYTESLFTLSPDRKKIPFPQEERFQQLSKAYNDAMDKSNVGNLDWGVGEGWPHIPRQDYNELQNLEHARVVHTNEQYRNLKDKNYISSHWQEPNVLAHTREDVRELPGNPQSLERLKAVGYSPLPSNPRWPDESPTFLGPRESTYGSLYGLKDLSPEHQELYRQSLPQKGKFIQEVQSDWHQAGKEQGYVKPVDQAKLKEQLNALTSRRTELSRQVHPLQFQEQELRDAGQPYAHLARQLDPMERELDDIARQIAGMSQSPFDKGVPDAPFKDTWPDLALKKHVMDVVNSPDQNWLGFTSGKTQADRYDLAKHVQNFEYHPELGHLDISFRNNGGGTSIKVTPDQLHTVVGRDMAKRILENPTTIIPDQGAPPLVASGNWHTVNLGPDEQATVGGEGMKHFYDNVLPSRLNKILKPFGGSVESGAVQTGKPSVNIRMTPRAGEAQMIVNNEHVASLWPPSKSTDVNEQVALRSQLEKQIQPNTAPAWLARFTPEMKAAILKKGLPLLSLMGLMQPVASHDQSQGQ